MGTFVFDAFFLTTLFVACIVAPFAEELIFRGFLYSGLKTRLKPVTAAVVVSLLFSYIHGYGPCSSVMVFCTGLVLTLLREKSGGLAAPMLCHACINLTVYLQALR
jgi:membrane protease YdiL (CAAX protease family)